MKQAWFTKLNRAGEFKEVKYNGNKIAAMRVASDQKLKIIYG
ncbi:MAG: hypothetical protein ACK4GL_06960 [Flavobacteriales bacterium]